MVSLKRIFKLIIKELHLLKSDKRALFMAILLPPLIMAAFSSMAVMSGTTQEPSIDIAIVNYDDLYFSYTFPNGTTKELAENAWAEILKASLENSNLTNVLHYYNINETPYGMLSARELLAQEQIVVILTIPSEFSEAIDYNFPAILEAIVDGSNTFKIRVFMNNLQKAITEFQQMNNVTPYFEIEQHVEFTPGEGGSGVLGMMSSISVPFLIIGATLILTLLVIVKEAPLSRLLMTPVTRSEILISKYITYSIVMSFQVLLIFSINSIIGLHVSGSILNFFIAMIVIGFYGITLGILISTISTSEIQANQYFLGVFLISVLVSGMFVPVENMAPWLQGMAYAFPLASAIPLLSNISLKGLGLFDGNNLLYTVNLLVASFVIILLTIFFFYRKKLEV